MKISIFGSRLRPRPSITTILRITLLKVPSCFTRCRTIAENNSVTTVLTSTCNIFKRSSERVLIDFDHYFSRYTLVSLKMFEDYIDSTSKMRVYDIFHCILKTVWVGGYARTMFQNVFRCHFTLK